MALLNRALCLLMVTLIVATVLAIALPSPYSHRAEQQVDPHDVDECALCKKMDLRQANQFWNCYHQHFYTHWKGFYNCYTKCHKEAFGRVDFDAQGWKVFKQGICQEEAQMPKDFKPKIAKFNGCMEAWVKKNQEPQKLAPWEQIKPKFRACITKGNIIDQGLADQFIKRLGPRPN